MACDRLESYMKLLCSRDIWYMARWILALQAANASAGSQFSKVFYPHNPVSVVATVHVKHGRENK